MPSMLIEAQHSKLRRIFYPKRNKPFSFCSLSLGKPWEIPSVADSNRIHHTQTSIIMPFGHGVPGAAAARELLRTLL
jgi:hypothetical protein